MNPHVGTYRNIVAARAKDPAVRETLRQSGGALAVLLGYLLDEGDLDYVFAAVRKEGQETVTMTATSRQEVLAVARLEQPIMPDLPAIISKATELDARKAGLVLTPCQAEAMQLLEDYPVTDFSMRDRARFVVSSFCFGTFTETSFQSYVSETCGISPSEIIAVTNLSEKLEILLRDGKAINISMTDVLEHVRSGCLICTDLTGLCADLSAGVIPVEPRYTTLILRSALAESAVERAVNAGQLEIAPGDSVERVLTDLVTSMAGEKARRAESARASLAKRSGSTGLF